ncbi:putative Mn2+ efflux pump MntP [Evansella vedderi]|uniref:Mn2+ efflux pump MntP n=1 Tax=Evansella vedderi TaxID=38282 RepID=A0ABT9ZWU2_9BACI|nr:manganese efflux pump [Evansella vedderi]MDQ0255696.1 putative Mn2+ efflux pump MntP [Evansella vedderi]
MYWQIIILAVASNIDDLGAGFSLGLKGRLPWRVIWIISILSGLTMAIGILLGGQLSFLLPSNVPHYIATFIFICIGLWFIFQGYKGKEEEEAKKSSGQQIGWKTAFILGIALGIDSVAAGISGGLSGFPILLTSILAWFTSFLFLWVGSHFGSLVSIKFIRDFADFFSGILFLLLAAAIFWF